MKPFDLTGPPDQPARRNKEQTMQREPKSKAEPITPPTPPTDTAERAKAVRPEMSITAKFIGLLGRASNEEIQFMEQLLDECGKGRRSVPEVAFMLGALAFGLHLDTEIDELSKHADDLNAAFLILWLDENPAAAVLRNMLSWRRREGTLALRDMLDFVELAMHQENAAVDAARGILGRTPEAFRAEIRAAVRKHPELLQEAGDAR